MGFLLTAALSVCLAQTTRPLSPTEPPPKGQRIEVKDGDTVVIPGDARVRIVHRSQGNIRAIYDSGQRWLVLLIDFADSKKGETDGAVDSVYTFQELDGVWPLGERWEGRAVVDDYTMLNTPGGSLGITTDGAFIQLFSGSPASEKRYFLDERAIALGYHGSGRANAFPGGPRQTFDEIEARAVADAVRNTANGGIRTSISPFEGPGGTTFRSSLGMTVSGGASPVVRGQPPPQAPVRVGGNIPQPKRIVDVPGVLPAQAAQAGIRGVVILEIVVDTDGSVKEARVLRSVPLLDQAAIDAAKQWRYEPTQLNGQPVPVIMTVQVPFQ